MESLNIALNVSKYIDDKKNSYQGKQTSANSLSTTKAHKLFLRVNDKNDMNDTLKITKLLFPQMKKMLLKKSIVILTFCLLPIKYIF